MKYVALLRGINVGGKNIIKMASLRTCLEEIGLDEVQTYIQSGNIVFRGTGSVKTLENRIEQALKDEFDCDTHVLVLSRSKFIRIIEAAPKGFGSDLEKYQCDVVFLKRPLTSEKALSAVEVREGVDTATRGENALYISRLKAEASKSRFPKIVSKPEYRLMTIRNWNTTTKLQGMLLQD